MLYIQNDKSIRLTRGDTARLQVLLTNDLTKKEYVMEESDVLTLTVKKRADDESEIAFQKISKGSNAFHIEPKDTKGLSFRKYKYDVQLEMASGDVYTVIEPTVFEIMPEVT